MKPKGYKDKFRPMYTAFTRGGAPLLDNVIQRAASGETVESIGREIFISKRQVVLFLQFVAGSSSHGGRRKAGEGTRGPELLRIWKQERERVIGIYEKRSRKPSGKKGVAWA